MNKSNAAVLDSNISILTVVNSPLSDSASHLWDNLLQNDIRVFVPRLWISEITSVIRKLVFMNLISSEDGRSSLKLLLASNVNFMEDESLLAMEAFNWAERLGRKTAYDCFYVALADHLEAELWSTDIKLINSLNDLGWPYIRELKA